MFSYQDKFTIDINDGGSIKTMAAHPGFRQPLSYESFGARKRKSTPKNLQFSLFFKLLPLKPSRLHRGAFQELLAILSGPAT